MEHPKTQSEFRDLLIESVTTAFALTGINNDELPPAVFILTDEGVEVMGVSHMMRNSMTKSVMMQELALAAHAHEDVAGIAIVSEVWTAFISAKEFEQQEMFVRPEDRPDRGEAAMIQIHFRGHGPEVWSAPITRNEKNERTLGEFKSANFEGGTMAVSLFPPVPVEHIN